MDPWAELPDAVKAHPGHLKDFRDAVRDGSIASWTVADWRDRVGHVLADVIDWLRLNDDRL